MNCIFCNQPIPVRSKGDHVIPQGLGHFYPEATIMNVCRRCDSRHGNGFERIALRTGLISFFRFIHGIKSKNNRKKPAHNPQKDTFNAIESKEFLVQNANNYKDFVELTRNGELRFSNEILVFKKGIQVDCIKIPIMDDIRETCNFIQQKTNQKIDGIEYELRTGGESHELISKELLRRGVLRSQPKLIKSQSELNVFQIRSTITNNHFRFIASIILKAMVFTGYERSFLSHLIGYVDKEDMSNVIVRQMDLSQSGFDALDQPPADIFYHEFEWIVTQNSIQIEASILAHRKVNGFRFRFSIKSGNNTNIMIPYGKIIAKYTEQGKGTLSIFLGDQEIDIANRMKNRSV